MTLYNPNLRHDEKTYNVPKDRSLFLAIIDAHKDGISIWLMESSMKIWVRIWVFFLFVGAMAPCAFVPHPYAISSITGMILIFWLNGRELIRIRGINKNMGWPHVIAFIPTMIVGILSLTTDGIGDDGKLTWEGVGDDSYKQVRYVVICYSLVVIFISTLFDIVDTVLYYKYDMRNVERSAWTSSQLSQTEESSPDKV